MHFMKPSRSLGGQAHMGAMIQQGPPRESEKCNSLQGCKAPGIQNTEVLRQSLPQTSSSPALHPAPHPREDQRLILLLGLHSLTDSDTKLVLQGKGLGIGPAMTSGLL